MEQNAGGWANFLEIWPEIWEATVETGEMVFWSTLFSVVLGFFLAVFMILTHPKGLKPRPAIYWLLDVIVNIGRSFPFIILLIAILPFTRAVVGTTIGTWAAIVPLTVAAIPFAARLLEGCLLEVDHGVVEAARSFGAGNLQIVFRVLLPEALPSIVLNIAVIAITLLGYSAMAGTVGGGGLGNLAINYGYRRFRPDVMRYAVVLLIVVVQAMQSASGLYYKKRR